jgi:N-acetylglucosamine kinase-like BadF-type ATPase
MTSIAHIGLDAGGTKIEALGQCGSAIENVTLPSVNARKESVDRTANRLAEAVDAIFSSLGNASGLRICAGVAGAATPYLQAAIQKHLADALAMPPQHIAITSDARIAFQAAFPGFEASRGAHILVISGTGSGCYSFTEGERFWRTGGWGSTIGDPGSGTALGLDAVRHVLECLESDRHTELSHRLIQALSGDELSVENVLDLVYQGDFRPAALAPVLLDSAQALEEARNMVTRQCSALAKQVERLATRLESNSPRVALTGGLCNHATYQKLLSTAISNRISNALVTVSERSPATGALELAQKMA